MDPNLDGRLRAIEAKLESIERTVIKVRKVQRTNATVRALYWVVIILLSFGAFYFVQPYINQLKDAYGFVGGGDSKNIEELLKQFQGEDN